MCVWISSEDFEVKITPYLRIRSRWGKVWILFFLFHYFISFISWSPNCTPALHVGLTARSKQSHHQWGIIGRIQHTDTKVRRPKTVQMLLVITSVQCRGRWCTDTWNGDISAFFALWCHFYSPTWGRVVATITEGFKNESRKKGRWTKLMRGLGNRYEKESTARCQRVINEDSGQPLLKRKLVNKTWRVGRPGWWRASSKVELKKNNCRKRQFYGYQIHLVQRADRLSDHPGKHRLSLAGGQTFTSSDKCPFKKASCCIWEWKPFMVLMKQKAAGRSHYQLSRR